MEVHNKESSFSGTFKRAFWGYNDGYGLVVDNRRDWGPYPVCWALVCWFVYLLKTSLSEDVRERTRSVCRLGQGAADTAIRLFVIPQNFSSIISAPGKSSCRSALLNSRMLPKSSMSPASDLKNKNRGE